MEAVIAGRKELQQHIIPIECNHVLLKDGWCNADHQEQRIQEDWELHRSASTNNPRAVLEANQMCCDYVVFTAMTPSRLASAVLQHRSTFHSPLTNNIIIYDLIFHSYMTQKLFNKKVKHFDCHYLE